MTKASFDLVVIGAGIAGLAIAELFSRNGQNVALVEKNATVCRESSGGHHEWFHFGSLYSIFPRIWRILWSGLRRKCPHCHRGQLFVTRYTLHDQCPACGYRFSTALDDLVILTYVGSASISGLFMLAVFVIRSPKDGFEMLIYLLVAIGLLFGTMQHRKGFAIGLLYVHKLLFGEEVAENEPNEGASKEH